MQERFKSVRARGDPHRHRGPDGPGRAPPGSAWNGSCRFTTSYHTASLRYVAARLPVPGAAGYAYMRWFHNAVGPADGGHPHHARGAGAPRLPQPVALDPRRRHRACSSRDAPASRHPARAWPRPIFLNVGRVAVEKNIEAFAATSTCPGPRWWSATARPREPWPRNTPSVIFAGARFGDELAALLRRRRRLRLPVGDRHLRPGDPGGHGRPGRRWRAISAPGPASTSSPAPGAGVSSDEDLRKACLACLELDPRDGARLSPSASPGGPAPRSSCSNLQPYPEPEKTRFWRRLPPSRPPAPPQAQAAHPGRAPTS